MNSLPLHPLVVHLPIALGVLMPLVSLGLLAAWWRQWLPKRAWTVVVALQALLVASGVVALRTGEADEERVEHVAGERNIERHEEAAQVFVGGSAGVLALALAAAAIRREKAALGLGLATALGTVAVLGLGYRTGHAGGQLVYQHGAAAAFTTASAGGEAGPGEAGEGSARGEGKEGGEDDD